MNKIAHKNEDSNQLNLFKKRYAPYILYFLLIAFAIPILIMFLYWIGNTDDYIPLFISILMAAVWVRVLVTLFIYNLPIDRKEELFEDKK